MSLINNYIFSLTINTPFFIFNFFPMTIVMGMAYGMAQMSNGMSDKFDFIT
jgi:hypothetical protein